MKKEGLIFCSLALCINSISLAGQPSLSREGLYTVFSAGIDVLRTNRAQNISLLSPYEDYYTGQQSHKGSGSLGLGLGLEREARTNLLWQIGFSGYFNTSVDATGYIWQFGLPDFENSKYNYQIQSSRLVATGKLLNHYHQIYHPYVSGELGASFNRAFAYYETPLIEEVVPIAPFTSHTQSALTWGIGFGVDMDVHTGLRLGLGYQFADLGRASLGVSPAQETNQTLSTKHLYDNQLRIQLTALT